MENVKHHSIWCIFCNNMIQYERHVRGRLKQLLHYRPKTQPDTARRRIFSGILLLIALLLSTLPVQAATISDRSGGSIYWGGKYVNIKPSGYRDTLGSRTRVDQMEVVMKDDVVTVKITGPYFYNYTHKLKRTQDAPPGDLYIASQGWKVSGKPPHNDDMFEASEGWDYVVSFENKKVYALKFSDVIMTSDVSHVGRYRAQQAWRGGYGEAIDDAEVILTDRDLTFIFSVRNMTLRSDIGLHWTMKCGNDIVEGSASLPPIAISAPPADPADADVVNADPAEPVGVDGLLPASLPIPAAGILQTPSGTLTSSVGGWVLPAAGTLAIPIFHSSSGDYGVVIPQNNPVAPAPTPAEPGHIDPHHYDPTTPVPEPSAARFLLIALAALVARKRLSK